MNSLPDELCQQIFAELSAFNQRFDLLHANASVIKETIRLPARLAVTCQRWRALVYDTPTLWAFIYVRDGDNEERLRTRLDCTRQHALDVWIHQSEDVNGTAPMFTFNLLTACAHRWRRVRIDSSLPAPEPLLLSFLKSMPQIEQLVLCPLHISEQVVAAVANPQTTSLYFCDCPNLRSLATHPAFMFSSPLSKLTFLDFNMQRLELDAPLWAILRLAPSLEEVNINYDHKYSQSHSFNNFPPHSPDMVRLPALRRLGVFGSPVQEPEWDLRIDAPYLETISVSVDACCDRDSLFRTFDETVNTLRIVTVQPDQVQLRLSTPDITSINCLTGIETLELSGLSREELVCDGDAEPFFECFHASEGKEDPYWAPTLPRLILRDCVLDVASCGSLALYIQSRMTSAAEFDFQLINTQILKREGEEVPLSMIPVLELFAPYFVQPQPDALEKEN